jgi:D-inositol-3-phosphate glycosyltransferase
MTSLPLPQPPAASIDTSRQPAPRLAVLCLSNSLGGLELNSLKFAGWMQERGWSVTFLAPPATPLVSLAARWQVPVRTIRRRRSVLMPLTALAVSRQLERLRIEVLVVTQNKDLALAALVKTLLGGRLRIIYQQHMQLGRAKRDWFHSTVYKAIDAWLTPLPGLARQVQEKTRFAAHRLHVVPLGLPLAQFWPATHSKEDARRVLHLPAHKPLLGILGRLDEGKGQAFVIEVLHRVRAGFPADAELVVMGELTRNEGDAYLQELRQLIARLGLEQRVHFRNFQENPAVFYHAIDVFVLASTNETYGMVTLEAMAAGVPVVAAATGGTVEIVEGGRTGLLYPHGKVDACAWGVRQCLCVPEATAQRAGEARQEAEYYSHHQQCQLTEDVLQGLGLAVPQAARQLSEQARERWAA